MNNRQNGRRRGRGGQQARNGQPGLPERGSRLDNRARGNAAQLLEKYKSLARDAQMAGDRVNTEYYLQFADHYFRVLSEARGRFEDGRPEQRRRDDYRDDFGRDDGDGMEADDEGAEEAPPPRANGWGSAPEPEAEPVQTSPVARDRAPRDAGPELPPRATMADEGERFQERRPRRGRTPRAAEPAAPTGDAVAPAPAMAERIEVDRLPQGFGTAADPAPAAEDAPAPRRRAPRRPRPAASNVEA